MAFIGNSLAQGLISGANIQDGTVDTPDIATSAVSTAKVADSAITTLKLNSAGIAPTITGGTINGAVIGGTTAAAGSFTTVGATGDITIATTGNPVMTVKSTSASGIPAIKLMANNNSVGWLVLPTQGVVWGTPDLGIC